MNGVLISVLFSSVFAVKLSLEPKHPVDQYGRRLVFHGVNAAFKLPPYLPQTESFDPQLSISAEDIAFMQQWGFNLVRFAIFWEAVEIQPGVYNNTYLAQVNSIINTLGKAGIYTVLDSHQDLFSRRFCGEGMPFFYTPSVNHRCDAYWFGGVFELMGLCKSMNSYDFTLDSNQNPEISQCLTHNFELYYMSPEVNSIFYNFYNNQTLLSAYKNFWKTVSSSLGSNPYIIAYDLLNEPWPGGFYEFPEYLVPGVTDHTYLQDFYFNLSQVIRPNTQIPFLAIEPTQLPDTMSKDVFPVGFTSLPDKSILNDHSYCCEIGLDMCINGEPSYENATTVCRAFHKRKVEVRSLDAERLGVGLTFTEFGACSGSAACIAEIEGALDAFDSKALSWAYWQYKGFGDFTTTGSGTEGLWYQNGTLQVNKVKALSRTYIKATQGIPKSFTFNNGTFVGTFELNSSITMPTEIYINSEMWYPNGVSVEVSRKGAKITVGVNSVSVLFVSGSGETIITIVPAD
jgi:endoglycosylceramidase